MATKKYIVHKGTMGEGVVEESPKYIIHSGTITKEAVDEYKIQEISRKHKQYQPLFEAANTLGIPTMPTGLEYLKVFGTEDFGSKEFLESLVLKESQNKATSGYNAPLNPKKTTNQYVAILNPNKSGNPYIDWLSEKVNKKIAENEAAYQEQLNYDDTEDQKRVDELQAAIDDLYEANELVELYNDNQQLLKGWAADHPKREEVEKETEAAWAKAIELKSKHAASDEDDLKEERDNLKALITQKKRVQNILKMNETATNDPDFEKFVKAGDKYVDASDYEYMKDDEFKILTYYAGKDHSKKGGGNQADTYMDLMEETLNQREGEAFYKKYLEGSSILETLYGAVVGIDQFVSGIGSIFNTEGEYAPASSVQYAGQLAREDLADSGFKLPDWLGGASFGQAMYDTLSTTANMVPSILTTYAVSMINPVAGTAAGTALLGTSAAGNAYQQAINSGMDVSQARTYGLLVGTSEAVMSAALSKVFGGNVPGAQAISNKLAAAIKGVENGFVRFAANAANFGLKYGTAFFGEGIEEGLQELLTPLFENIALGYDKNGFEDIDWAEVAYSTLLGGFTGGNFELLGSAARGVKRISSVFSIKKEYNTAEKTQNLLKLGLSFPTDSKVNKLATEYNNQVKESGKLSINKVYNLVVATENALTERLTSLGEKENVSAIASASLKAVTTGQLTKKEIAVLKNSKHGAEVLESVSVTEEAETSELQSSANGENVQNSRLQSTAEGGIINNGQETVTGDDINGNTNPELLGGRTLSTADRSGNGVRQQGENSRKISSFVGSSGNVQGRGNSTLRAGDSGWFVRQADQKGEIRNRFEESIRGKISRIAPSGFDTIGRKISNEIRERFKNTVFKDENGNLLSLYHWTQATFEAFAKGEFGFHFGTLDAAHDRYAQSLEEDPNTQKGIYKEVYLNITNPYYIPFDAGAWCAYAVAYQLKQEGIITDSQYNEFYETEGFWDNTYDNPAAQAVRDFLKQKGYDGIIYENDSEDAGGISAIAFDADQILTVAENGVLKSNNGVSEADLENGPASFVPESDSGAFDSSNNDSGASDNASDNSTDDSGEMGFREPDVKGIYRKSTDAETAQGILTGKRIDAEQRHINDIVKKLDKDLKLVWVDGDAEVLCGKKGRYDRDTNTMYMSRDTTLLEKYYEVFKHEFVHRLESKKAYQSFKKYLLEKSVAFENYARAKLREVYPNENFETREDVIVNLREWYYSEFMNDEKIKDRFKKEYKWEDADYEMVSDFVAQTLFKGKEKVRDIAQSLADEDINAIKKIESDLGLFAEMATDNRNLLQKVIDAIKDFINNLKHVPQNKSLVEDLEYIEQRLSRVYASKDTKKAADMAPKVQFSFEGYAEDGKGKYKSNFPQGTPKKAKGERILKYIQEVWSKKPIRLKINEDGVERYIEAKFDPTFDESENTPTDASKLMGGNRHGTAAEKRVTLDLADDYYQIASEARYNYSKDETGKENPTHKDVSRWHYFVNDIYFAEYDSKEYAPYRVTINVKEKSDGEYVYSFSAEKQRESDTPRTLHAVVNDGNNPDANVELSNNKLTHNKPIVKNNISDEGENYSDISDIKEQFSSGSPAQQARENRQKYDSGEITLEEYLKANDELWGRANEEYGMFPQGENAQAPIATPKAVAEDKPTERFTRTIIETGKLNDEMLQGMEEKVLLGDFAYKPISDEKATKTAQAAIENGTAEDTWNDAVNVGKRFNKNQIAIGEQLLADAIKNGDTQRVLELSAELADALTRAGQIVQAARLLKKMTGAGRLVSTQRMVKTINKDLRQKYGEDRPPIKISDAAAKRLVNAKTENGIQHAYDEILKEVAEQVPVTFLDKWNAWRYFAMLSNPKTHIRNFVGNVIFIPAFRIRYVMAVGMERAAVKTGIIKGDAATKSLIVKKEYTAFAKKDGKRDEVKQLLKGNKYNDKTALKEKQRIFKNSALEFLTRFNSNALEAEDMLFKNKHYIHALAGFLQARGVDLNNVSEDVLTEARIYAVNEARKATFNDESALANAIQNFGNKNLATNIMVEGVLPFKRTPINIIKRGIEYSPIGLAKTLTKGAFDIKKGKITPTEFIDGLASGLTGTGIMLVGMLFASWGIVSGGEEDDELSAFEKLLGKQEYAIEIFGTSYTVDWAAPSAIPFFIGAEIVNTVNSGEDFSISQIGNAVWNSLEPITNLSMLSGLQGVIESTRYAEPSQILASIAGDAITTYAMQGIPSLSGAVSRTIDPTQRSWYVDKNDKVLDAFMQTLINNVKSKIPGLSYTQIPKIDAWGREVSRGGTGERIAENFISPGYYSTIEYDEVSKELKRIFVKTGANVFPKTAPKNFSVNEKMKYLTAEEYVTYAKAKGEYSFDYIYEFLNGNAYKNLTDEERAEVIEKLYKLANAKAKAEVSEYDLMKQFKTVINREKNGGSAIDYYVYLAIKKE